MSSVLQRRSRSLSGNHAPPPFSAPNPTRTGPPSRSGRGLSLLACGSICATHRRFPISTSKATGTKSSGTSQRWVNLAVGEPIASVTPRYERPGQSPSNTRPSALSSDALGWPADRGSARVTSSPCVCRHGQRHGSANVTSLTLPNDVCDSCNVALIIPSPLGPGSSTHSTSSSSVSTVSGASRLSAFSRVVTTRRTGSASPRS